MSTTICYFQKHKVFITDHRSYGL